MASLMTTDEIDHDGLTRPKPEGVPVGPTAPDADTSAESRPRAYPFPGNWILVKGGSKLGVGSTTPVFAASPGDINAAVAAFIDRDYDSAEPLILIAPALRTRFMQAAMAAQLDLDRETDIDETDSAPVTLGMIWEVTVDLRPWKAWWAAPLNNPQMPAEERDAQERATVKAGLGKLPPLTDPQLDAVAQWVIEWALELSDDALPHGITVGAILTGWARDNIERRLFPVASGANRGWSLLVQDPARQVFETVDGQGFVRSDKHARVLRELQGRELPLAVEHLVGWMTKQHDGHSPSCESMPTLRQVTKYLERTGVRYPKADEDQPQVARSAARLLIEQGSLAPPSAVLPYLAWRGRLTILAAREKQGKSTLVGSAVAAATQGLPWLGQPTAPGNVLWLHEEAERDVIARLDRFGADLERVFLLHLPLRDVEVDLKASVAAHTPTLIVIDSLMRFATSVTQETSSAQWRKVLSPLLTLAHKMGIAILALHHAGKRDGEYRDSTEIGAAADMLIQMPGGLKGRQQRLDARGRIVGVEPFEITVELAGDQHHLVGQRLGASVAKLTANQGRVLAALRELVPDAGAPAASIPDWEFKSGLPKSTFDRVRDALVAEGLVEREGQPGTRGQRFRPSAIPGLGPTSKAQARAGLALVGRG